MARPDTWLSLEQLEYRADALRAAALYVRGTASTADRVQKGSITSAACWCAEQIIRTTEAAVGQALQIAHETGGAPISADAHTVFKVFHAVEAVRKDALAAKAFRKMYEAERAAKEAARAEAAARERTKPKRQRKAGQ